MKCDVITSEPLFTLRNQSFFVDLLQEKGFRINRGLLTKEPSLKKIGN